MPLKMPPRFPNRYRIFGPWRLLFERPQSLTPSPMLRHDARVAAGAAIDSKSISTTKLADRCAATPGSGARRRPFFQPIDD